MTTNKSIDGLSTRAAKTAAAKAKSRKTIIEEEPKKVVTKTKTTVKKDPDTTNAKAHKPKTSDIDLTEEFVTAPTTNMWDAIKADEPEESGPLDDFESLEEDFIEETTEEASEEPVKTSPKKSATPAESKIVTDFLKPVQAFDFDEEEGLIESEDTVEDLKKSAGDQDGSEDEDYDEDDELGEEPEEKPKKPKKPKKKPSKKRRVAAIVALVIVLIITAGVLWLVFFGNDIIAKLTGGRGNLFDLFSETYEPLKTDVNGRTNILAFGTGGYDMSGEEGGGVHDGAQLTDSIMLISFDQKTGDVAMVSLPRDLKGPATCTATGKINEVYWCNGGNGDASIEEEEAAATALMEAVGSILGVDIQYFAHLNWGSIVSIVDTLGGITITLDEDILDYTYTGAVFYANTPYTINGAEAVGLARARHGTTGGDFSRGASQQKIIIGIKNRIFEKGLSLTDMLSLVTTLGDNLRTNFSLSEMKTLAHSAEVLDFDVMRQISLYPDYMTTGMLNGISYVLPKAGAGNYGTIQAYLAKQLSSDPRNYEEPTIAIYNASDAVGIAADERDKLESKGYTITAIDNAPEGEYPAGTTIYAIGTTKPGTKSLLEENYNLYAKSAEELPATIAPNYDFIIILNNAGKNN